MPSRVQKLRLYDHHRNSVKATLQGDSPGTEVPMEVDVAEDEEVTSTPQQRLFIKNINQVCDRTCFICDRIWYDKGIR